MDAVVGQEKCLTGTARTEMSHRSAVRPGIKATKGRQNGVAASAVLALTKL